jgi:hypothetical protein
MCLWSMRGGWAVGGGVGSLLLSSGALSLVDCSLILVAEDRLLFLCCAGKVGTGPGGESYQNNMKSGE